MSKELLEQYWCPTEFQDRLNEVGGFNKYGQPNFILVWSQTATFRAGGEWTPPGQASVKGYRDIPFGMDPCWMLMQWQQSEKYGSPEYYYMENLDWDTGLQTLAEYPYWGRYEVILPLIWKGLVNGRLVVQHMPLTSLLVDLVVPVIKGAEGLSYARIEQIRLENKAREDREHLSQIESRLADAFPAFGGAEAISASHLTCNTVVKQKMDAINRHWQKAASFLRNTSKGMNQGNLPKFDSDAKVFN